MTCKYCGSSNVSVQAVGNVSSRGGHVPFWYWLFGLWLIDFMLYSCIVGFFGLNIHHIFRKTKTKVNPYCVCQDCGKTWKSK